MHYTEDPFLIHFIKKEPSFYNPILNRGTWVRTYAIRKILSNFIKAYSPCQIVSFGSGFDTNYFLMKALYPSNNFRYLELDFIDVVEKKKTIIAKTAGLSKLANYEQKQYSIVEADIRNISSLEKAYKAFNLSYAY